LYRPIPNLPFLNVVSRCDRCGRDSVGISAAILYYACLIKKESFTQIQVADASRITPVTVRNRFHEIKQMIQIDLN